MINKQYLEFEMQNVKNAKTCHCRIGQVVGKHAGPAWRFLKRGAEQFHEKPQFWEEPYIQTFQTDRTGSPPHPSTLPMVIC